MNDLSPFPPKGLGRAPALVCGFGSSPTDYCGEPATWHVFWTSDLDNGLQCDFHHDFARSHYVFYADHPYDPVCSLKGARYDEENNRCFIQEEDDWLTSWLDVPSEGVLT